MADPALTWFSAGAVQGRVNELQDRLDYFVALFSSVATWMGVGATVLGILIAVVFSIAGFVGFAEIRRARAANAQLNALVTSNKEMVVGFDERTKDYEARFASKLSELEAELDAYRSTLTTKVDERIRVVREVIAGELCYRNSDFFGALVHFQEAHSRDPSDREASYYLGRTLTYMNDVYRAVAVFEELAADATDPKPLRGMALALRFVDPDRALNLLERTLGLAVTDPVMCGKLENERGLIHRDRRRYEQALTCHKAALGYARNDTVTLYFVGLAELLCGQINEGRASIRRASACVAGDLEAQTLKPIWASVIQWSLAFVEEREDDAGQEWTVIRKMLTTGYVKETVMAHARTLGEALGRPAPEVP